MIPSTAKVTVAIVLAASVGAMFLVRYPFVFSLGWPSLALARVGVPHSWVVSVILILGGVAWLAIWSRKRGWVGVVAASLLIPACYCALAFWFVARASVPLPAVTPYDSTPALRAAYLSAFDSGYRDGALGIDRSYCFYPEAETRGFYDGAYQGRVEWCRMFGRAMSEPEKRRFESAAGIDGVKLELK